MLRSCDCLPEERATSALTAKNEYGICIVVPTEEPTTAKYISMYNVECASYHRYIIYYLSMIVINIKSSHTEILL